MIELGSRIADLREQRKAASIRAGELQEQFNQTVIQVHRLDGAIAGLEALQKEALEPPDAVSD